MRNNQNYRPKNAAPEYTVPMLTLSFITSHLSFFFEFIWNKKNKRTNDDS